MSTRSSIILKVRKEDIGKKVKFDPSKLTLIGWGKDDLYSYGDESGLEKSEEVTIKTEYIGVYCHSDGTPQGIGEILKEQFSDYDKLLNLLVGGDISFIDEQGVRHYANRKGESWEWNKPTQMGSAAAIAKHFNENSFLFKDGKWSFKFYGQKSYKKF